MTQPQTKAGRDPEGAVKEIEAQAQERSTCPACDGTKRLVGRYIGSASREDPDEHIFACSNCDDEGTVPAGPGALAAWQKKAMQLTVKILDATLSDYDRNTRELCAHLAAMPQAQPDAGLLKALKEIDKIGELVYPNGADVMDTNPFAAQITEIWRIASAAIAQAEQGAAG